MSTLSNVEPLEGGPKPSRIELVADVNLRAKNAHSGVSVRYAHNPTGSDTSSEDTVLNIPSTKTDGKQWYVLRATYGRERQAYDYLTAQGEEAYLPMRYVERERKGQRQFTLRPLLPNILFVYATADQIDSYLKRSPALSYVHYYYNRLVTKADGTNPPLTVPCHDMMSFIHATNTDSQHVRLIDPHRCHYRSGDTVRVTAGAFRGVEGRVARVAGQQRVVVTLTGLCSVATAYIPNAFLERIG